MKRGLLLAASVAVLILAGMRAAGAVDYPGWTGYPPFYAMTGVIAFDGRVYGATSGGIFQYDPVTDEYTTFYKNSGDSGLSANDATCVSATSRYLYFGFESAGIMRFDPENDTFQAIVFPEYIPNDISVYSIYAASDTLLYIGHSAGLDVLNLVTGEVRVCSGLGNIAEETPVNEVAVFGGKIWACTEGGLAVADVNAANLDVPSAWTSYTYSTTGINCILRVAGSVQDTVYLGTAGRGIARFDPDTGTFSGTTVTVGGVTRMTTGLGLCWAVGDSGLYVRNAGTWSIQDSTCRSASGIWGTDDRVWIATEDDGLKSHTGAGYAGISPVPGAKISNFIHLALDDDGGVWGTTTVKDEAGSLVRFGGGVWDVFINNTKAPTALATDASGNMWVMYWGGGIDVIADAADASPDSGMTHLDPGYAIFRGTIADSYVVCRDAIPDDDGNMWVANYQEESAGTSGVVVTDGYPITKSRHFSPARGDIGSSGVTHICVDNDGWLWAGADNYGLMCVYYGDDPFDSTAALTTVTLTASGTNALVSRVFTAIQEDAAGQIWVGTDAGLNCITKYADLTLSVGDSTNLLRDADTEVLSIEIDPFNNKWIGTANGLVRVTSNNEQYAVYTTENSGLFSNKIHNLQYDDAKNILWIGTDAGLNCLDVGGNSSGSSKIMHVYPNPFSIWGTDSYCTFDNLLRDSVVKVYTFRGDPVRELTAASVSPNGGYSVTWDGCNFKDEPVASGIYFFTGRDKNDRPFRDKMAVIRR